MLKHISCVVIILFSFGVSAQINAQDEQVIRETLGKDSAITQNFTDGLINIGKLLGCESGSDNKACEEVRDPWGQSTSNKGSKIKTKEKVLAVQQLEDKIIMGKGGKMIPKSTVFEAQKKYAGYSIEAIKARYAMYLKSCCFESWHAK